MITPENQAKKTSLLSEHRQQLRQAIALCFIGYIFVFHYCSMDLMLRTNFDILTMIVLACYYFSSILVGLSCYLLERNRFPSKHHFLLFWNILPICWFFLSGILSGFFDYIMVFIGVTDPYLVFIDTMAVLLILYLQGIFIWRNRMVFVAGG